MTGRRVTVGLSLLCALAFCALAAPSAMAAKSGTAYYTCVIGGTEDFEDEHCTEEVAEGDWGHELIPPVTTEVTLTNIKTGTEKVKTILVGEAGGSLFELEAESFMGEKTTIENSAGEENMVGTGEGEGTYTGVKVLKPSKKCGIAGGTVKQLPTTSATTGMEVEFKPKTGTVFAEFEFTEPEKSCALKGVKVKVEGSATGIPKGGTLQFTKASTEATKEVCEGKKAGVGLCAAKKPAFFTTELTVKMNKEKPEDPDGNAIVLTTTEP
jgi:hypothetical protein